MFGKGNTVGKAWRFGQFWQGKRCGAKTRAGHPCKKAAMKGRDRCRNHGGASTGPRTSKGRARIAAAQTTHGRLTKEKRAAAKRNAAVGRQIRAELLEIEAWALDRGHLDKDWRDKLNKALVLED
ncbi:HGGxSTG domain-containing protein [Roseobacter sp. HKCC-CH-9208]|uniref:HGGxSTG domain-containing protein n=1 Tax=Roseobacter sp. HKCC-CH-9208 TaxID=3120339 RepID=UPI0030EB947E